MGHAIEPLLLVFDARAEDGLGHRSRMEALSCSLRALHTRPQLRPLSLPLAAEFVVIDSYRVRADDAGQITASRVVAVDDLLRNLAVDLVVDAAPEASVQDHPAAKTALAGPGYAIIDSRLRNVKCKPPEKGVESVLVTTGAADRQATGLALARSLKASLPHLRVRLVPGDHSIPEPAENIETSRARSGLAGELAGADVVVTAGGVTMLESLCLGRPTVALSLAENQRRYVDGAEAAGAVVQAVPGDVVQRVSGLLTDTGLRKRLAAEGRRLVDGLGARRVAMRILELGG